MALVCNFQKVRQPIVALERPGSLSTGLNDCHHLLAIEPWQLPASTLQAAGARYGSTEAIMIRLVGQDHRDRVHKLCFSDRRSRPRTRKGLEPFPLALAHGVGSNSLFSRASSPVRVFRRERDLL